MQHRSNVTLRDGWQYASIFGELPSMSTLAQALLFSMVRMLPSMNSFQNRVHDKNIVSDAVAQLIFRFCVHGLALRDDQLLL